MSALNGFLQNHANGCDFYESGFTDYCTCGRFEARQEYKMLLVRIAELEALTTWQPIETAPERVDILILVQMRVGIQVEQVEMIDGHYFRLYYGISAEYHNPTHWMPLPSAPTEEPPK